MRHNYCTVYSEEYIYKGLLLYNSLEKHDEDFIFYFVFLNDGAKKTFEALGLKRAVCICISELEEFDRALLTVKSDRNTKEYIWTVKGSLMLYLLTCYEDLDHIIWLDGDTLFFSSPEPIYTEWGTASILLTEEGFTGPYEYLSKKHGVYNTGLMGFKRDAISLKCLEYFRSKLIEWCYDRFEPGLWSDQMHVCDWRSQFENVVIIKNQGINLTPFKLFRINVEGNGILRSIGEDIFIDDTKLIFFHYYGFNYFDGVQFDLCSYDMTFSDKAIREIYYPYINASIDSVNLVRSLKEDYYNNRQITEFRISNYFNLMVNSRLNNSVISFCTVLNKETVIQGLALYYSIRDCVESFHIWVCCLDNESYEIVNRLGIENITAIHYVNVMYGELQYVRESSSDDEFREYIKPYFLIYVTKNNVNSEYVAFIESDCYLLADPSIVFSLNPCRAVYLIRNRQLGLQSNRKESYSSSILLFYRSKVYFDCLFWWKKKCSEVCFENKKLSLPVESLCIKMWPRLLEGIQKVKDLMSCENSTELSYIAWNARDGKFYLKGNQVLSVKPYRLNVNAKAKLNRSGIKKLVGNVTKTLETAEDAVGQHKKE